MSALEQEQRVVLDGVLDSEYLSQLPPLLDTTKSQEEQLRKNRSRAFSAFALHNISGISKNDAANAVIDDFDDFGVDAIYYHAQTETLYLVQSKLKAAEQFSQDEALAFCQGIRKLIKQDFSGFNKNVENRLIEIEDVLDNCSSIKLVVAHIGSGISKHAKQAIEELLADEDHGEERLDKTVFDYDAKRIVEDLRKAKAYQRIDADLSVEKCSMVSEPKVTYFGLVQLSDLVKLHEKYGKTLYERNIRTFLGLKTEVNASIQKTLRVKPKEFMYLNNGVTALCQEIQPKGAKQAQGGKKRLKLRGFSIINGAQTIASSAAFLADNKGIGISEARVSITLIKADTDGEFGKTVTRARNHQNLVLLANFAALDDEQERLRRDLAYLGIHYVYKAEAADGTVDDNRIRIDEAAQALAILRPDPRYVVWLKKEPAQLLDTTSSQYKALFSSELTAFRLANAVRLNRYVQSRMTAEARSASGLERLIYKHGCYALAWVMAKRISQEISGTALIDTAKITTRLSTPFDDLRQHLSDETKTATMFSKGPLGLFRNQTDAVPLIQKVAILHYGLAADPIIEHKKKLYKAEQPYPVDLFEYLVSKAPQIGNLT
ncbi:MAG TPA: AIPR family protein [Usitatibacteraceae bacterium]